MKRAAIIIIIALIMLLYYQLDYKRHFISNNEKTEFFTIWQRIGNNCFIIPGKYYSPFTPSNNYVKTANYRNYVGVVWNTLDSYDYKISIYNDFEVVGLSPSIKLFQKNDSLLLEYNILDSLNANKGVRIKNDSAKYFKSKYDYNYIDLNRIYGIKISK